MEEWDEEDGEGTPYAPMPFSPLMLATDLATLACNIFAALSDCAEGIAKNFAHAHNKRVQDLDRRNDGEKFAQEILSGLEKL